MLYNFDAQYLFYLRLRFEIISRSSNLVKDQPRKHGREDNIGDGLSIKISQSCLMILSLKEF